MRRSSSSLIGRKLLFALNLDEWNFCLTIRWGIWDGICGVMPLFRSLLRTIVTSYQRWLIYQGFQTAILILVLGWMVWCFMFFFDWFFCPLALWSFILTPPFLHELNLYWTRLMSHTSWTSVKYSCPNVQPLRKLSWLASGFLHQLSLCYCFICWSRQAATMDLSGWWC